MVVGPVVGLLKEWEEDDMRMFCCEPIVSVCNHRSSKEIRMYLLRSHDTVRTYIPLFVNSMLFFS